MAKKNITRAMIREALWTAAFPTIKQMSNTTGQLDEMIDSQVGAMALLFADAVDTVQE